MARKNRQRSVGCRGLVGRRRPHKQGDGYPWGPQLERLEQRLLLSLNPIIGEVEAGNTTGITDTAGVAADWVEIYNPDPLAAVNLSGWSLKYQKTGSGSSTTWAINTNVVIGPGESRVIFCDSASAKDPVQELHTNFNLSKSGATVQLISPSGPSGTFISSLTYPNMSSNTSYGPLETLTETDLVAAGATATYYCSTDNSLGTIWTQPGFNDSSWESGPTGLGFVSAASGFACTLYQANVASVLGTVEAANAVISTPSEQNSVFNQTASSLNFLDTGGSGHFVSDSAFPGLTITGTEHDNYVLQATGTITVTAAQAGYYTFGVNSDEGFSLTITGASFANGVNTTTSSGGTMAYDGSRTSSDSLATTYLAAGSYPVSLVYFQGTGGASMEFYAAKESTSQGVTSFDATNSHLVGDTAHGGLTVTSSPFVGTSNGGLLTSAVATDVKTAVQTAIATAGSTSLYTRITFDAANYAALSSLTLRMKYDDGYVAYLNGVQIASGNAPGSPTWNSQANAEQNSAVQATTYQDVDVSSFLNSGTIGHLMATGNVLSIQVLMSATSDGDMLVVPELAQMTSVVAGNFIFATPTPGAPNALGDVQASVTFSTTHGFFSSPFQVTLAPNITGTPIYYTTDCSVPSATNGTLYTGPITINSTTVLQVAMVVGGTAAPFQTETYVFPAAVVSQPSAPTGFPTIWNGAVEGKSVAADYAMSSVPGYTSQQVIDALSSLPSMSVVTTTNDMFGPSGIYSNPDNQDLEAGGSLEYFNPSAGTTDWGGQVGVSITGGVGRSPQYLKHAIRISFDASSGPTYMNENLFGDGYLPNGLVLRQAYNDGWSWGGANAQFIIDQWTRDALTAMGTQNVPGVWVQLFVNGLYWGVYNAVANLNTNYAAYFFGGKQSDYDVYHYSGSGFEVKAGDMAAWNNMFNVARYGNLAGTGTASSTALADPAAYALMAQCLNLPSFCDYIITNYYGGNWDWDWHNYSAVYSKTAGTGLIFQDWDGEGNLQDPNANITGRNTTGNPTELFQRLLANPEFRQMFADHVYKDLNTVLSPASAAAIYQHEASIISTAVLDESARWGNISGTQYTPANWNSRLNWELGTFFPGRTATMFAQFTTAGMYPSFTPPTLSINGTVENGGPFTIGDTLTMAASTGTIYFTTDGTDPRASGSGVGATAVAYTHAITLTQGEVINARVLSGTTWSALNSAPFYVNLAPFVRITELMYSPVPATPAEIAAGYVSIDGSQDFEFIELQNTGGTTLPLQGLAFTNGITFTFPDVTLAPGAYIIVCSDPAAFALRYGPALLQSEYGSGWLTKAVYSGHLNNGGEEITLSSPVGGVIEDFTYDNAWYPQTDGGGFSLLPRSTSAASALLNSSAGWKPGGTPNGTPGTAEEVNVINPVPDAIVVSEVLSHTSAAPGDRIEFYNTTSQPINIGGWFVSDNSSDLMKYRIATGTIIAPGGYFVLTENYNFGALSVSDSGRLVPFALNEHGDDVYLTSNYGSQPGGYREHQAIDSEPNGYSRGLYTKSTGGTDFTLLQTPTFGTPTGTTYPGAANSIPYVAPLVTDEIMYSPTQPTAAETAAGYVDSDFEYIELYNRSSSSISLGNYYVAGGIGYTPGWLADGNLSSSFTIASITFSGATATVIINSTSTGFQNGDTIHIDGAAQTQYNGDFTIGSVAVNPGTGKTILTYTVTGSPASPATPQVGQSLSAGQDSEYQTLESQATATWGTTGLALASYTVYAHLNLYDGDNNLRSDMDSSAQYTVTCGSVPTTVLVNQNQVAAILNVTSLTYDNLSGLVSAAATNSLTVGSIVHINGATQAQYNGTFVILSATANTFTYALAAGLNLSAATGTIQAGLNDAWISLGTYTTSGTISVQLTRTTNAKPDEWTVAGAMELVTGQQTTVLGAPTFNSYSIQHPAATLAPGAYAVVASNVAAFAERYNPNNSILVLGAYSGHLSNGGDTVDIYQVGHRDDGSVAPLSGFVPSYRIDHVNYSDATPWPLQPDGNGPAMNRIHTADYGNDPINWQASNVGGTPGLANLVMDATSPTVPTNLAGQALLSPTSEISLTWTGSFDLQSNVDHYTIYRNGSVVGTSISTAFADTTALAGTNYTYTVAAVNRDGYASAQSIGVGIGLPSIISNDQPTSTQIEIYFSEPLTAGTASNLGNYLVSGMVVSGVALARSNTKVTLTLSSAMAVGTAYTVTATNLMTISGNQLPAAQTFTFTYAVPAWTATIYQASVGVTSLASSQSVINSPGLQSWSQLFRPSTINYTAGGAAAGHYTNDALLPNQAALATAWINFVIAASTSIYIPAAGNYTFDVDSDDGFSLTIAGATFTTLTNATNPSQSNWMAFDGGRGNADTLGVAKFTSAGYYPLSLIYFQNGGLASVEVSAVSGSYTAWSSAFKMVGDTANGGLALGGALNTDTTTPPAPANLRAAVTNNNTQISLAWSSVTGLASGVDHYNIYCNGSLYATSTTTSYTATSGVSSLSRSSYQIAAVNFDGIEGVKSAAVTAMPAGIAAVMAPAATSVQVQFTELVDPVSAQNVANYSITNSSCTISSAVLQSDGYTVILTTSALGSSSHTLTVSNIRTQSMAAMPTNFMTTNFVYTTPGWSVTAYKDSAGLGTTISAAQTFINTPSQQTWVKAESAPYINYIVSGADAHFTSNRTLPGTAIGTETDNFAVTATGTLVIPAAGTYTIGVNTDDGFRLTITGATFTTVTGEDGGSNTVGTNTLQYNAGRGPGDTLGVVTFASAGSYAINLLWFQGGGGAECEVYAAAGTYTTFNTAMKLIGDTANGGLAMARSYTAPAFSVGVSTLSTGSTSPALTGTITDPAASVNVRVNGYYYSATNNGDGTWMLPPGKISPLGTGIYNVMATGTSLAGITAFDSTTNELSIDTTSPTMALISPPSPTLAPVSSIAIQFSEPVANFTLQNLQLTLANGGPAASAALEGATLTSTDNQHWTLGNLNSLTTSAGTYVLTLGGLGSTITDMSGNLLVTNANTAWTMANPVVQSINTSGLTITHASTVQYALTFNENVTNVQPTDFALGTGGASGTVVSVGGSGSTYTVTVSASGNGTLGLNLVDDNSIVDQYGNPLGGPALQDGNFTGQVYTIDTSAPTVSIGSPSAPYATGGPISYTVTYADANFNSSTLAVNDITLCKTGTANGMIAVTGSGLARTVTISSITGDGSLGISILSGTAADLAGNTAPAAGPSMTFTVDNTAPTVMIQPAVPDLRSTPVSSMAIVFSEPVTNFALSNLSLARDGISVPLAGATLTTTDDSTWALGGLSGITAAEGRYTLTLCAGVTADMCGNALAGGNLVQSFAVDMLLPTVAISPVSPNPVAGPLSTLTISFNKVVTGFTMGDLSLTRDGDANLLPGAATLTTSDDITFSLANLAGLTEKAGTYLLTVGSAGVSDRLGWSLSAGTSVSWSLNTIQTSGGDTLKLKANDGNPLQTDVFLDTGANTPSYSVDLAAIGSLVISSTGGATALTLDFANGNPLGGLPAPAVSLNGGTFEVTTAGQTSADLFALTLSNATTVTFNTSAYLAALTLNTGSAASLASGGDKVISVGLLVVSGTAKLDLADNDLIDTNMSLTDMQALVTSGKVWSSSAVASSGIMGLALGTGQTYHNLNGISTLFAGEIVAATDDLVRYTYCGDANLDGTIDLRDYRLLDVGYVMGGMLGGYNWGDFNLDGRIDAVDYAIIDQSLQAEGSALASSMIAQDSAEFGLAYAVAVAPLAPPSKEQTSETPATPVQPVPQPLRDTTVESEMPIATLPTAPAAPGSAGNASQTSANDAAGNASGAAGPAARSSRPAERGELASINGSFAPSRLFTLVSAPIANEMVTPPAQPIWVYFVHGNAMPPYRLSLDNASNAVAPGPQVGVKDPCDGDSDGGNGTARYPLSHKPKSGHPSDKLPNIRGATV